MQDIFEPRGMNRAQTRTDGWVGGRADTWRGHYHDNPASRVGADARRMAADDAYAAEVAEKIRDSDRAIARGGDLTDAGLTAEPLSPGIGVVVRGIDMADPTDLQVSAIRRLLMERKVVFFRDQGHVSRAQHAAFGRR